MYRIDMWKLVRAEQMNSPAHMIMVKAIPRHNLFLDHTRRAVYRKSISATRVCCFRVFLDSSERFEKIVDLLGTVFIFCQLFVWTIAPDRFFSIFPERDWLGRRPEIQLS
jgi:hypothetical protein